jgi:hypothetical protein
MIHLLKQNYNSIKYILLIVFVMLFLHQCNQIQQLKTEIKQVEVVADRNYNNLIASQDSIKTYIDENNNLVSQIKSFEFDINDNNLKNKTLLKKYSSVLNENKKLKSINTLISTELNIRDSIINSQSDIVQDSTSITIKFNDEKKWDTYNWRTFNGQLKLIKNESKYSILNSKFNFDQGISLKTSIINENGRNILKITTPYDRIKFTDIENINLVNDKLNPILQRPKNWSIGIGIQYGININIDQFVSNGISVGIGVQYSPNWLRF